MTSSRKPLEVLQNYPGKELEQPDKHSPPSMNPLNDVPLSDDPPPWFLDSESVAPGNTLPDDVPPRKSLQDSLLIQPAQPTANPWPQLQFHGHSIRDRPGYVSPPRGASALAWQDGSKRRKRWYPSDDDLKIYGQRIGPETGNSEDDSEVASSGNASSYLQQGSRERPQDTDRSQARHVSRDSWLGAQHSSGGGRSQQTSSATGTASALGTFPSPRTQQELQTLQIMSEVNPQGFEIVSRHLDRAKDDHSQHRTRSASPSDQLRDRYADDPSPPGSSSSKENNLEDDSSIRTLFPGVLKTYGPFVGTSIPQARQKYKLSSLGTRRTASIATPAFSPLTPPFRHAQNTLDRAEPSRHNPAERNRGPLSNPKKRTRKASNTEDSPPRRREFSVLRDEILENPAKKRRVSSHLVRESVSEKYNANVGSTRRRSDSSISKSSNGTPNRRLSLRRSGSFAKTNAGLLEIPTQAARLVSNTPEAQGNEAPGLIATSANPSILNPEYSTRPGTLNKSQKPSQPLRRSTRLSALQQELTDQTPSKEEQHPEATYTTAPTSPEAATLGTSVLDPASSAQYTTVNLNKDRSQTQSGRVSKSTVTKKSKGLAASQLPQRRSSRVGKGRL
ncbi:MAG: hypothetical protein Q9195_001175 [Heterodermia aff. obscurata]